MPESKAVKRKIKPATIITIVIVALIAVGIGSCFHSCFNAESTIPAEEQNDIDRIIELYQSYESLHGKEKADEMIKPFNDEFYTKYGYRVAV